MVGWAYERRLNRNETNRSFEPGEDREGGMEGGIEVPVALFVKLGWSLRGLVGQRWDESRFFVLFCSASAMITERRKEGRERGAKGAGLTTPVGKFVCAG